MKLCGIDLGIKKVAISYVEDTKLVGTEAYESRSPMRTQQLMDLSDFVYESVHHYGAGLVVIEDTLIGNNRKYSIQLSQTMGAVLAGLGLLQSETPLDVLTVDNKKWKKGTVGNGNADKHAIRYWVDECDPAYAELCGGDQDRYDAAAVGLYGWHLHSTACEYMEDVRCIPD